MNKKIHCFKCGKDTEVKQIINLSDSDKKLILKCGHTSKRVERTIHEEVRISDSLELKVKKAVEDATKALGKSEKSKELIQRIQNNLELNADNLKPKNEKALNELIKLGLVTHYLDNTISISPLGVKVLERLNRS